MSSILPERRAEAAERAREAACPKCGAGPGVQCAGVFSSHYARAKAWAEANGAAGRVSRKDERASREADWFPAEEIQAAAAGLDCDECGAVPGEPCRERVWESGRPWRAARCVPGAVHRKRFLSGVAELQYARHVVAACDTPADLVAEFSGQDQGHPGM